MIYSGIDTAARISAQSANTLKENGIDFAVRYLVPESGITAWKALTKAEANDIRAAGLALMLCWELTGNRVKGGTEAGAADGLRAWHLADAIGVPAGTVIYFAADYNAPAADFDEIEAYLTAAQRNLEQYRAGLYGHEALVREMAARGVCRHFWQCVAWSNQFDAAATVRQYAWQGAAEAKALAAKVGFAVDLDSCETLSGMWLPPAPPTEAENAHAWALRMGIVDETMRDVGQLELALWRYHRIFSAEDTKNASGLLG